MTTTTLKIKGMTCGGCVNSVSNALRSEDGVNSFEVLLDQGIAKIDYNPALITPQQLVAAIDDIGFEASCNS